jgi:Putative Flp pilus-assembly TadE/G-like
MRIKNWIPGQKSGKDPNSAFLLRFGRIEQRQRGVSLVIVAFGLFVILAVAGLVIDLSWLYLARGEAQRAADAAALAGAQAFVSSGFTSGEVSQAVTQTLAAQQAASVGNQNLVGGLNPQISSAGFNASCPGAAGSDGCFDFSNPNDPRITVVVQRTAARADGLPVFFMRIFGVQSVDVSAQATAEAYNPSGGSTSVSPICVKPWLMPNCDPSHTVSVGNANGNANCPVSGGLAEYFVNPNTGAIVNPAPASSGGAIGELMVIKPGNPLQADAPSKYYPVFLPQPSSGTLVPCPSCGSYPGGSGPNSAALYRGNIECCNPAPDVCAQQQIQPISGDMTGPTAQGVDCLINESNGAGMDVVNTSTSPFQILAGNNNPLVLSGSIAVNSAVSTSDSVVTLPLYDGVQLCPGSSCPSTVTVNTVGFMQIFVKDETSPQGTVEAYILNITGCVPGGSGGSGGGSAGEISAGSAAPIPVRLIHN